MREGDFLGFVFAITEHMSRPEAVKNLTFFCLNENSNLFFLPRTKEKHTKQSDRQARHERSAVMNVLHQCPHYKAEEQKCKLPVSPAAALTSSWKNNRQAHVNAHVRKVRRATDWSLTIKPQHVLNSL